MEGAGLLLGPVIAPGDMTFYEHERIEEWEDDLLIGGLVANGIVSPRCRRSDSVTEEERISHRFRRGARCRGAGRRQLRLHHRLRGRPNWCMPTSRKGRDSGAGRGRRLEGAGPSLARERPRQEVDCMVDRGPPHPSPPCSPKSTVSVRVGRSVSASRSRRGLRFCFRAARSGDAGDRNREVGFRAYQRPFGHLGPRSPPRPRHGRQASPSAPPSISTLAALE